MSAETSGEWWGTKPGSLDYEMHMAYAEKEVFVLDLVRDGEVIEKVVHFYRLEEGQVPEAMQEISPLLRAGDELKVRRTTNAALDKEMREDQLAKRPKSSE
jgi:hypothetical protein